jgi:hypothetical protein
MDRKFIERHYDLETGRTFSRQLAIFVMFAALAWTLGRMI